MMNDEVRHARIVEVETCLVPGTVSHKLRYLSFVQACCSQRRSAAAVNVLHPNLDARVPVVALAVKPDCADT
jgi:hypothetical protein